MQKDDIFAKNIYNLKQELLLSHFFFQSFANFIQKEKRQQDI